MSLQPHLSRLAQATRRFTAGIRRGHVLALSAVAVAAFGLVGLTSLDRGGSPLPVDGRRISIEVVAPVEPELVPGSVMEVGELVDGFTGPPPRPPGATPVDWREAEYWEEGWVEPSPPPRRPTAETAVYTSAPAAPPRRYESRWFGFDAPRRDFEAERAERRARREAMERRAWEAREVERRRDVASREEREREAALWRDRDRRRDDRDRDRWREDDRAADIPSAGPYGPEVG